MPSRHVSVKLVVASQSGDRFLVRAEDASIDCPRLNLRSGSSDGATLGELVEAAMRQDLGVSASYIGLLAFRDTRLSYELVVLATLKGPLADGQLPGNFRMLPPHELLNAGLPSNLVDYFATARELCVAERHTAGRELAEQHAADLGVAIQRARDRSLTFLAQHLAIENGCRGWAQYFDSQTIGLLSTAQGLLAYVHAGQRDDVVDDAAATIERMQNPDGGWQVRRALVGHESPVSITESTCYCLWALLEAGRRLEQPVVRYGLAWLEQAQQPDGGWPPAMDQGEAQVSTTAAAIRILARCDRPVAVERGAAWLRAAQRRDGGWGPKAPSGYSSPAYTAHAVLALLASGTTPTQAPVQRGCEYLRTTFHPERDEPWRSISANTVVDDRTASRLEFRHFATPWALAALSAAGRDLTDPTILLGTLRLLQLQEATGAWHCELTAADTFALWAVHDALFALGAIVQASIGSLAPLVRTRYREREREVLDKALGQLLTERPLTRTRHWIQTAWLSVLSGVVALLGASQVGLLRGLQSDSGFRRVLAAGATAVIAVIPAIVSAILVEEYRIRRNGREGQQTRAGKSS
jgi:hypothetical protein